MWDSHGGLTSILVFDALDVVGRTVLDPEPGAPTGTLPPWMDPEPGQTGALPPWMDPEPGQTGALPPCVDPEPVLELEPGVDPEPGVAAGGFSASELQTLRDWGGYSSVYLDDAGFLEAFGFQGASVPGYFKGMAKWFLDGTLDRQDLINALSYLEGRGVLG